MPRYTDEDDNVCNQWRGWDRKRISEKKVWERHPGNTTEEFNQSRRCRVFCLYFFFLGALILLSLVYFSIELPCQSRFFLSFFSRWHLCFYRWLLCYKTRRIQWWWIIIKWEMMCLPLHLLVFLSRMAFVEIIVPKLEKGQEEKKREEELNMNYMTHFLFR